MTLFFLFIFIIIPIIEIGLFIQIGKFLGVFITLLIIIITGIIGVYLLHKQGLSIINKLKNNIINNKLPIKNIIHGTFIFIAGILLLTPGFLTDFIGFSFFIPKIRLIIINFIFVQLKKNRSSKGKFNFQFYSSDNTQNNQFYSNDSNKEIEGKFNIINKNLKNDNTN